MCSDLVKALTAGDEVQQAEVVDYRDNASVISLRGTLSGAVHLWRRPQAGPAPGELNREREEGQREIERERERACSEKVPKRGGAQTQTRSARSFECFDFAQAIQETGVDLAVCTPGRLQETGPGPGPSGA